MANDAHVVEGDAGGVTTLLRAALPGVPGVNLLPGIRKTTADLDGLVFTRPAVEVRRDHVDSYSEVCGFPNKDTVPLSYLHVLGFPLHLRVMTDPAFPFPAIGTVHLSNIITGYRPVAVGETVAVTVHPERLQPHVKGQTVDFVTEVTSDGVLVWEGRSTYLRRGRGSADARSTPVFDDVAGPGVTWPLAGDLGRRYAAVSGDHNPIHLYPLTAKALGFPRQIAHGMWSKARCIAALENRLPDAVTVEVAFKKPIFLPGKVSFASKPTDTGYAFALTSPKDGSPHLLGRATRT
jgi:acyl dehydratase